MSASSPTRRNPGPPWGYAFLLWAERWWPRWIFRPALMAGTWAGLAFMPVQRGHSREYLRIVLGRAPRTVEVWRHFFAFTEFLMTKLRAGRGAAIRCELAPENAADFEALLASGRPALFGTFHFGSSDLLGYMLGARGRAVSIVRLRVGNSDDTRWLGERFSREVTFLWINDASAMLFDLKTALDAGKSLALKCDRLEFSAKAEPFRFLDADRVFPFTIYHLAVLFQRPVVFCVAEPGAEANEIRVVASPVYTPDPAASREKNLGAARLHFQGVVTQLETMVRQRPSLWFNFLPLNPVAASAAR
jgi:predicted LPLAT superfamily acyltransferase